MFPLHHCHQGLTSCNAGHGRRSLVCLYWTGFLGLHYAWVKACLQGLAISDSKVTMRAPAILIEDSRPQAILKFHHPSSLDYRAHHGLPVYFKITSYVNHWLRKILNDYNCIFLFTIHILNHMSWVIISFSSHFPWPHNAKLTYESFFVTDYRIQLLGNW